MKKILNNKEKCKRNWGRGRGTRDEGHVAPAAAPAVFAPPCTCSYPLHLFVPPHAHSSPLCTPLVPACTHLYHPQCSSVPPCAHSYLLCTCSYPHTHLVVCTPPLHMLIPLLLVCTPHVPLVPCCCCCCW